MKASCTYTSAGTMKMLDRGAMTARYNSTYAKMQRAKNQRELGNEMRDVADGIMHLYMDHLKELLHEAGLQ